jgi:hypothetical protein
MEKDLSLKKQLLDVLVIHKEAELLNCRLPDGFEDLAQYNLVTFKSHAEKLSLWTFYELVGHFVNLRKQVSPSMDEDELLPEEQFRLYAVCVRFPQQLATQLGAALRPIKEGVYETNALAPGIRIVVANQLLPEEHNALLHLFSTQAPLLAFGRDNYHIHSRDASTLLLQLFWRVQKEMGAMSTAWSTSGSYCSGFTPRGCGRSHGSGSVPQAFRRILLPCQRTRDQVRGQERPTGGDDLAYPRAKSPVTGLHGAFQGESGSRGSTQFSVSTRFAAGFAS